MPRPFRPARPAAAASVPASPDVLALLDAASEGAHRYHRAIHGFADLLWLAATNTTGGPTGTTVGNWAHLARVLGVEGERVGAAVDAVDRSVREIMSSGGVR